MAAPTTTETKQIVGRFMDAVVNGKNLDRIEEFVTEDVRDHTPVGDREGSDAFRETTTEIATAFPDFEVTPHDVVGEGDTVAVRMTQRGTHEGPFLGYDGTGKSFEITAMAFARIEDGKIAERWVQPDLLGMVSQLGVVEGAGA
jgi:steroid delta-isomerase-like uncharacterized protein